MLSIVALLALACFCDARPSVKIDIGARASFAESYIIGGVEATPCEFPWQLSQQRQGTAGWSHSCGATLLSANYALSAAHCVEGAAVNILRVWAGLHDRTATANGRLSNVLSYKMHESYNVGAVTYANDISILTLETPITEALPCIGYAKLPTDNLDLFAGRTGTMSGWGRINTDNTLPLNLQKADIGIITTTNCNSLLASVSGARVSDLQICFYDSANQMGSCNGDSGGPFNINYPSASDTMMVVAGVTSWGVSSGGSCMQTYPSIYTRTSGFLPWIATNTP
jgi:secreted trypsin-like serine protease